MKKSISIFLIPFILLVFILNFELNAQSAKPSESGVHEHDGFFLRLQGGAGYGQLDEPNVLGRDLKLSGIGMPFIIEIGGVIGNNLIAYGVAGGVVLSNPDLDWGGQTAKTSDTRITMSNFGGGITYYLVPSNVYFDVSALASRTTLEFENRTGKSDIGFGFNLSIGKEWWISDDWALGAAVFGHFSQMGDGETGTITNKAAGVVFSATFN